MLCAALALVPAPAQAAPRPTPAFVNDCAYVVTAEDAATVSGILYAGPIGAVDTDPAANPVEVTVTCSLQSAGYSHTSPADFAASASGTGAATLAPVEFTVPAPPEGYPVGLCTRLDVKDAHGATTTYYANSQNSTWSTGPDGTCAGAGQCLSTGPECTWWLAFLEELVGPVRDLTALPDPLLCPVLASLSPGVPGAVDVDGTGDTYVLGDFVWDCPPYGGGE